MGGDLVESNVIFNMVRETGDHGTFNSWDRKEWFYACPEDPTKFCFTPKITHVQHNMFIGPAGWNMDVSIQANLLGLLHDTRLVYR